jgi:photosystem II PsbW protein
LRRGREEGAGGEIGCVFDIENSFVFGCVGDYFTGLPALHMPRIVCSAEERKVDVDEKKSEVSSSSNGFSCSQLMVAMSTASALTAAHPALALVDERLSTEGTGLGLGLSNSKLTWILVGVTTLIWVLYFVYSTGLPEGDDDSGLSL